ncbi:hypothetical protein TR13x_08790 [Caloranaerobacter sp. TR13]|uniref:hypothetical protein n=1 Tax=Caloranaerobacter sp. TR13 TaxID=1302151 RepID=UPI0006D4790B|nr:hypothetical protein [Caloranaerobacter sp. TR13]KPU26667.1 hypothetical protein TR13x_08790 [Caloranaerobacter sp. TR13]
MYSEKNYRRKFILLVITIIFLLCTNFVFYIKYKEEKDKNKYYVYNIYRTILASTRPHLEYLITNVTYDKNLERWKPILKEIREKSSDSAKLENFIVIEYDNGNTLMVEVSNDFKGDYYIEDMFFLDEKQYKKLIYTKK